MDVHKIVYSLCCAAAGAGIGCYGMSLYYGREFEFCRKNNSLFEAYKYVKDNYEFVYNDEHFEQCMISGLAKGLDNRFCAYSTEYDSAESQVNNAPSTISTGFEIKRDDRTRCILVTRVDEGSQAEKCGLKKDDLITEINGKVVNEEYYPDIVKELYGKEGKTYGM